MQTAIWGNITQGQHGLHRFSFLKFWLKVVQWSMKHSPDWALLKNSSGAFFSLFIRIKKYFERKKSNLAKDKSIWASPMQRVLWVVSYDGVHNGVFCIIYLSLGKRQCRQRPILIRKNNGGRLNCGKGKRQLSRNQQPHVVSEWRSHNQSSPQFGPPVYRWSIPLSVSWKYLRFFWAFM